jgi:hypothetical protein
MVAVIGMGLFTPWVAQRVMTGGLYTHPVRLGTMSTSAGYWWITHPPEARPPYQTVSINLNQLAMQEVVALIATAMGVFMFKSHKAVGGESRKDSPVE